MDTENINGYRSVYMAFGAFKVSNSGSQPRVNSTDESEPASFLTAMNLATRKASEIPGETDEPDEALKISDKDLDSLKTSEDANSYGPGAFLSYTRIITATLPSDITSAMENGTGTSPFDFQDDTQELKITISVSENSRIYTASGTDKDGNAFSKEIDPYKVDPTDTDYAGFATLCAYIRDTEGLADSAMQAVKDAAPDDITERGNYIYKVGFFSENTGNVSGAKKLFESMQTFFEKIMDLGSVASASGNNGASVVSVRSDASDTGSATTSGKGSYSRIMEELQEMIELMMQRMLNSILGIGDYEDSENDDEKTEEVSEVTGSETEAATESTTENAKETTGIIPSEGESNSSASVADALDLTNAVTL